MHGMIERTPWPVAALSALVLLAASPALAQTLAAPPPAALPTLAIDPQPEPSIWHGLSVGTEIVAVSGKHAGGVGGDVFASYDHEFANNIVLGVSGSTGYLPALFNRSLSRGFDFAAADVHLGYDMGRLEPFVTVGVISARPHLGAGLAAPGSDSLNLLLNGAGETRTLTRVGAGVNYAVTNNLTVGVAVSAIQGNGPVFP